METVVLAVVTFMIVGFVSTVGVKNVLNMGELIRAENVDIVGYRIESAAYGLDALNHGRIQMSFKGNGYKLINNETGKFLQYSYNNENGTYQLEDPYNVGYTVEPSDSYVNTICLAKQSNVEIEPGECGG
ncbi:MAG: hypothetical protein ABEJ83_05415 [Candidatus Nanohaloarchaea archaeon]